MGSQPPSNDPGVVICTIHRRLLLEQPHPSIDKLSSAPPFGPSPVIHHVFPYSSKWSPTLVDDVGHGIKFGAPVSSSIRLQISQLSRTSEAQTSHSFFTIIITLYQHRHFTDLWCRWATGSWSNGRPRWRKRPRVCTCPRTKPRPPTKAPSSPSDRDKPMSRVLCILPHSRRVIPSCCPNTAAPRWTLTAAVKPRVRCFCFASRIFSESMSKKIPPLNPTNNPTSASLS